MRILAGLSFGMLMVVGGVVLSIMGVAGSIEWVVSGKEFSSKLTNAEEPFMAVYKALEVRDLPRLQALLRAHPELARARGTNGNTLLNLESSMVGSAKRGQAPSGATQIGLAGIEALLAAGADPKDPNDRGWTALHQAAYANEPELADRLLAVGASVEAEAHGAGGTPLVVALFWGHREVADLLARHGVVPQNLRAAAGVGDSTLVETFFSKDGALTAEAGAALPSPQRLPRLAAINRPTGNRRRSACMGMQG